MSLVHDLENKKFDKRLLDWNLRNKRVTQQEYDQMIQSLEDRKEQSVVVELSSISDTVEESPMDKLDTSLNSSDSSNYPIQ
jgi:hypothetical protein